MDINQLNEIQQQLDSIRFRQRFQGAVLAVLAVLVLIHLYAAYLGG